MALEDNLLSLLIWLPIVAGVLVLATAGEQRAATTRKLALGFSVIIFLLSLPLYSGFDINTANMQFVENYQWVSAFNINYSIGVDGISMPLILLTTLMTVIVIIAGWQVITERVAQYMAAFLIMEGVMIGVFFCPRCDVVLCVLGKYAHSDVSHHRHLGRDAAHLCHHQILSLHPVGLFVDAGGIALFV